MPRPVGEDEEADNPVEGIQGNWSGSSGCKSQYVGGRDLIGGGPRSLCFVSSFDSSNNQQRNVSFALMLRGTNTG